MHVLIIQRFTGSGLNHVESNTNICGTTPVNEACCVVVTEACSVVVTEQMAPISGLEEIDNTLTEVRQRTNRSEYTLYIIRGGMLISLYLFPKLI